MIQRGAVIKSQLKQQQYSQQNYQQSSAINNYPLQYLSKSMMQQQQNIQQSRLMTQQMNYYQLSKNYQQQQQQIRQQQQLRNNYAQYQQNQSLEGNYPIPINMVYKNIIEHQQKKIQMERKGSHITQNTQMDENDNQSQISIDVNTKHKISEIETTSFTFDEFRIKNHRINTKINYNSKLFVFEFIETSREDDSLSCNQKTTKKIELGFEDISSIEVRLENDKSLMMLSLNKEFKKYLDSKQNQPQKGVCKGWIQVDSKKNIFITDQQIKESDSRKFIAEFRKDKLTKFKQGKQSHLDKLRLSELIVLVKGQQAEQSDINPSIEMQSQQEEFYYQMKNDMDNQLYDINMITNTPLAQEEEEEMFPLLRESESEETITFQKNLKKWTEDYKVQIIQNTFKCKKYPNGVNLIKKSTCPYFKCHKQFGNSQHLRQHLDKKHPYLAEMGLTLGSGGFEWTQQTLDFVLSLAKIYPKFVRKVISEQKKTK